ncbi:MAG: hypothetical protein AAF840_13650, partial [Bacteroidota bacterium]
MIDLLIVVGYFALIFIAALSGRTGENVTTEEYFLSNRNLRWPSIALSTIATNISGYQFLGMMGSAYLYGLAQANLEINAIQGILMAAFIFVPLYLKEKVITNTQFIKKTTGRHGRPTLYGCQHCAVLDHHAGCRPLLGGLRCRSGFCRIPGRPSP